MSLNNLGAARLSELGRRTEALEPTQEAVTLYRELAADNPAYLNDLAGSLDNLGAMPSNSADEPKLRTHLRSRHPLPGTRSRQPPPTSTTSPDR
ncbi:MAG: tetratricopeptide repeat protein [Microthrixaceae bacterium]